MNFMRDGYCSSTVISICQRVKRISRKSECPKVYIPDGLPTVNRTSVTTKFEQITWSAPRAKFVDISILFTTGSRNVNVTPARNIIPLCRWLKKGPSCLLLFFVEFYISLFFVSRSVGSITDCIRLKF